MHREPKSVNLGTKPRFLLRLAGDDELRSLVWQLFQFVEEVWALGVVAYRLA